MKHENFVTAKEHYDLMIDENNDPVNDPRPLREWMDLSDGAYFLETLCLSSGKDVLELGVGTGRLAVRTAGKCRTFTGIDLSPKTVERARENLKAFPQAAVLYGDFLTYDFPSQYDVIYSSQVFWHIPDKEKAICKVFDLLKKDGIFVLSTDIEQPDVLDYGTRKIKLYPDSYEKLIDYFKSAGLFILHTEQLEHAYVITAKK